MFLKYRRQGFFKIDIVFIEQFYRIVQWCPLDQPATRKRFLREKVVK